MPMRTEEKHDLAILQNELNEIRFSAFCALRDVLRSTPEDLKHRGQKTVEGALRSSFEYYLKKCDDLTAAYLKKYPD